MIQNPRRMRQRLAEMHALLDRIGGDWGTAHDIAFSRRSAGGVRITGTKDRDEVGQIVAGDSKDIPRLDQANELIFEAMNLLERADRLVVAVTGQPVKTDRYVKEDPKGWVNPDEREGLVAAAKRRRDRGDL